MTEAPNTLLMQAAKAVARVERIRERQVALLEWRRAQGWDIKKAEATLERIECALAEKQARLALLRPTPSR